MKTVVETSTFRKQAEKLWTEEERLDFITWLAAHPEAGNVIPGADGARKLRWAAGGRGKRGGVRVIYFQLDTDRLCLVAVYAKKDRSNMRPDEIKKVR
ncbi:MAG TPA: DNA-binding protein [Gammaproteobacteria bacterium]|nr:DNA-binding protein [Gammaproteobacteria bacterium]